MTANPAEMGPRLPGDKSTAASCDAAGSLDESLCSNVALQSICDDYLSRLQAGEQPVIEEYVASHAEFAEELRELLPMLRIVDDAAPKEPRWAMPLLQGNPPKRIGDYRIVRAIGRGGMGLVFEAVHTVLHRRVALKVLPSNTDADRQRFHREIKAAARLHHTNIVPVFDFGEEDGLSYYAMQFIAGCGLNELIGRLRDPHGASSIESQSSGRAHSQDRRSTECPETTFERLVTPAVRAEGEVDRSAPLSPALSDDHHCSSSQMPAGDLSPGSLRRHHWKGIAKLGLQAAEALHYANQQGVIHRDIKPSNLLLDDTNRLWVTDFGLAKTVDDHDLTATGNLVGTLRYIAPESLLGELGESADIYGLGLVLYELITLRPPFFDVSATSMLRQITEVGPAPVHQLQPNVPRDLRAIVQRAIERDPALRYRNAGTLADDLRCFVEDKPIRARRASRLAHALSWARRNRLVASLLVILALLISTGFVASTAVSMHLRQVVNDRTRQLLEAKINEAASLRASSSMGRRFDAMESIRQATDLLPLVPDDDGAITVRLRNELIGALGLLDIRFERTIGRSDQFLDYHCDYHPGLHWTVYTDNRTQIVYCRDEASGTIRKQALCQGAAYKARISPNGRWCSWWCQTQPPQMFVHDLRLPRRELDEPTLVVSSADGFPGDVGSAGRWSFSSADELASIDGQAVIVHDLNAKIERWRLPLSDVAIRCVLSPDASRLAVALQDAGGTFRIRVWDVGSRDPIFEIPGLRLVDDFVFSPDGRELAVSVSANTYVWDVARGSLLHDLLDIQKTVRVMYSQDGEVIITSGWEVFTTFWNAADGERLLRVPGLFSSCSAPVSDGDLVAIHSGASLDLYQYAAGREKKTVLPASAVFYDGGYFAMHPAGRLVALAVGRSIRFGDCLSGRELGELLISSDPGRTCFSPDGNSLFTFAHGVIEWPIREQSPGTLVIGPPRTIVAQEVDRGWMDAAGQHLVYTLGNRAYAQLLGSESPPTKLLDFSDYVACSCSHLREHLAVCTRWDGSYLVDIRDKQVRAKFPGKLESLITADGKQVFASGSNEVLAYSVPENQIQYRWTGVGSRGQRSSTEATTTLLRRIHPAGVGLIDRINGRELARFPFAAHETSSQNLGHFDEATQRLVSVSDQSHVVAWNVQAIRQQLRTFGLDWDDRTPAERRVTRNESSRRSDPHVPSTASAWPHHLDPNTRLQLEIDWGEKRREYLDHDVTYLLGRATKEMVLEDLSQRISETPNDVDLRVVRAKFLLDQMYDVETASRDIDAVLQLSPSDTEAIALRQRLISKPPIGEGQPSSDRLHETIDAESIPYTHSPD